MALDDLPKTNNDVNSVELVDDDGQLESKVTASSSKLSISELQSSLQRAEKMNRSLETYNRELRDKVDLLNAKFHLAKKFLYQTVSTQTDIHIPTMEMNGRVFLDYIMVSEKNSAPATTTTIINHSQNDQKSQEKLKLELDSLLNDMKSSSAAVAAAAATSDYTLIDHDTKTYFSPSTGLYYYAQSCAFYNPRDRSYYRYDSENKKYEFMYSLDDKGQKVEKKINKSVAASKILEKASLKKSLQNISSSSEEEEEGEIIEISDEEKEWEERDDVYGPKRPKMDQSYIISSKPFLRRDQVRSRNQNEHENNRQSSSSLSSSNPRQHRRRDNEDEDYNNEYNNDHINDKHHHRHHHRLHNDDHNNNNNNNLTRNKIFSSNLNKIPPVRMIVQSAQQLDIGSLILVNCMGGKIGTHASCAVIIPDVGISQV